VRSARVRNLTRGTVVAHRVEVAASPVRRLLGLMGRSGWADADGLLIRPCNSIHTCFMRVPIDALFVGRDRVVLELAPDRRPWRLGPIVWRAAWVLELPVGALEASRTRPDDCLVVEPCGGSP
jgi:uncharacterized protein